MRFSDINYNLYKVFITVYENKSMTRAAKELFIGQPNISRSIKELEKHLDVKLFYSNPRGVEPTSEGIKLYHKVMPALAWIDHGEKSLKEFNEQSTGIIKIAVATNFAGHYLTNYVSRFSKKYPNIKFDILFKSAEEALELLGRNRVNLVLSTLDFTESREEFEKIILEDLTETVFASRNFAVKYGINEIISQEQFEKLPYILIRPQVPLKKPLVIVDSQEMLFQFVINDIGFGYCLEKFLDYNHCNDPFIKFKIQGINLPKRTLSCLYNKNYLSITTEVFLNVFKDMIQ